MLRCRLQLWSCKARSVQRATLPSQQTAGMSTQHWCCDQSHTLPLSITTFRYCGADIATSLGLCSFTSCYASILRSTSHAVLIPNALRILGSLVLGAAKRCNLSCSHSFGHNFWRDLLTVHQHQELSCLLGTLGMQSCCITCAAAHQLLWMDSNLCGLEDQTCSHP